MRQWRRGSLSRGEAFDEQPMPGLDSEALDFRVASESFAPVRALSRRDLETLRLLTRHEGRPVPTVGGLLLFGKDRERDLPDAWIQAGRFAGLAVPVFGELATRFRVTISTERGARPVRDKRAEAILA
jgi:predicted HTH transcriptional regulator